MLLKHKQSSKQIIEFNLSMTYSNPEPDQTTIKACHNDFKMHILTQSNPVTYLHTIQIGYLFDQTALWLISLFLK